MKARDLVDKLLEFSNNVEHPRTWQEIADRINEIAGSAESGVDLDDLSSFAQEFLHTASGFIGSDHTPEDNLHYARLLLDTAIEDLADLDQDIVNRIVQLTKELVGVLG